VSSSGDDPPLSEGRTKPLDDATADTLRKSAEYRRRLASRSEGFGPGYRMTDAENEGRWFVDHGHAPTADELSLSCSRVDRNEAPQLIFFLDWNHLLTDEALTANIADVWSSSDGPELRFDQDLWRDYFQRAGATPSTGGRPTVRRGRSPCIAARHRNSGPTGRGPITRELAANEASGEWDRRPVEKIWVATVDPWRLLAGFRYPDEHDYVVDTDGLDIVEDQRGRAARLPPAALGDATLEPRQCHPPTVPPSYRRHCCDLCR
jgi:hypothetical protein